MRGRAGFQAARAVLRVGLLPARHAFDTPDEVRLLVDCGPARVSEHRRARARGCLVARAQHRRPGNPRRSRARTPITPIRPGGATSAARSRTTPSASTAGSVGAGGQFHVDRATRRRAASSSRPAATGNDSSANITATSGSRIRWCTGARSCSTRSASSSRSPTCSVARASTARAAPGTSPKDCAGRTRRHGAEGDLRPHAGVLRATRATRQRAGASRRRTAEQGGWISREFGPQGAEHDGVLGLDGSPGVTVLRTRITYTRSRPLASEPAIRDEHHQVVTADVPSGERTHALRHDDCFGLFNEIGDIDAETRSEAGLYRGGVRHLSRLTLTIAGLAAAAARRDAARRQRAAHDEPHEPRRARRGRRIVSAARHAAHHALAFHLAGRVPRDDPRAQFRAEHRGGRARGALRLGFRKHRRRARAAARRCGARAIRARRARQRHAGMSRRGRSRARDRRRLPHDAGRHLRGQSRATGCRSAAAARRPSRSPSAAGRRSSRCRSRRSRARSPPPKNWRAPRAVRAALVQASDAPFNGLAVPLDRRPRHDAHATPHGRIPPAGSAVARRDLRPRCHHHGARRRCGCGRTSRATCCDISPPRNAADSSAGNGAEPGKILNEARAGLRA